MADYALEARAQDINFVAKFMSDLHNLLAVLGTTGLQVVAPGTAIKIYKSSGSLSTDEVAEKALIPDSGIAMDLESTVELTYKKYRNLTGIESIGKFGYDVAVGGSNTTLLKDMQKAIRADIYEGLALGTGTAEGTDFQSKIAAAAAYIMQAFEDEAATPVCFVNPQDAFDYLGTHTITVENENGLSYLKNFMGMGNVIIDSNVPEGTVYGTAVENLSVYAASLASIPGMEFETDESGIIAVHNGAKYENGALETVALSGIAIKPIFTDRIVKVTTAA